MKKLCLSALALCLAAPAARAEDVVLQRFTQSLRALYETSLLCEYVLSPSPIEYANAIRAYVQNYYEDADSIYWVLPSVDRRAKNSSHCSTRLQQHLIRYAAARNDFAENYEDYPLPPYLAMVHETPVRVTVTRRNATTSAPARFKNNTSSGY